MVVKTHQNERYPCKDDSDPQTHLEVEMLTCSKKDTVRETKNERQNSDVEKHKKEKMATKVGKEGSKTSHDDRTRRQAPKEEEKHQNAEISQERQEGPADMGKTNSIPYGKFSKKEAETMNPHHKISNKPRHKSPKRRRNQPQACISRIAVNLILFVVFFWVGMC